MRGRRGGGRAAGRRGARRGAPGLFKSQGPYPRASPALPAPLSLSQGLAACLAAAAAAAPPRLAGDPRPAAAARGAGRASRTRLPVPPGLARSLWEGGGEGDRAAAAEGGVPLPVAGGREVFRLPPPSVSSRNCARRGCVCLQLLQSLLPPHPPPRRGPGVRPGRGGGGGRGAGGWWAGLDPALTGRTNLCRLRARSWGRVGAEAAGPQGSAGPAGRTHGSGLGPRGARAHRRPDGELQVQREGWLAHQEEPARRGGLRTVWGEQADVFPAPVTSRAISAQ